MAGLPRAILDPEEHRSKHPNIMIYGPSGVGKTPWIMQLPNLLVASIDPEGTISAKTWGKGTKVWPIRRYSDFVEYMEYLEKGGTDDWKYTLVDTVGTLQTRLLREILEKAHKSNPAKYDRDVPQIQDHQRWQNVLKRIVMDLNDMPITVIWTAHEMMREDADGDEMTLPLLPGGKNQYEMSMWVTSIMHVVGRVGMKSVETRAGTRVDRGVYFANQPPIRARDRTGTLQDSMLIAKGHKVVTTFPEIMGIIEAGGSAALERAEAMVEARTDDPDEADIIPDDPADREGFEEESEPGAQDQIAYEDIPPATPKRRPAKKTSGRTFRPADEED